MYTDDHDDKFQVGFIPNTTMQSNWWMKSAATYYGDVADLRFCPAATKIEFEEDGKTPGPGSGRQPFMAWGHVGPWAVQEGKLDKYTDHGSYGINGWLEDNQNSSNGPEIYAKY